MHGVPRVRTRWPSTRANDRHRLSGPRLVSFWSDPESAREAATAQLCITSDGEASNTTKNEAGLGVGVPVVIVC